MNKSRTLAMIVALGCGAAAAAPAYAATPAQFGQKCKAAWTGVPGSAAFKAYQPKCVAAAVAATDAATDAGNPTNASLTAGAVTLNGTSTIRIAGSFVLGAFPVMKYTSLSGAFNSTVSASRFTLFAAGVADVSTDPSLRK